MVKFNMDVAFNKSIGKGFVGIISRDNSSALIAATALRIFALSPLAAKALALRESLGVCS